MANTVLLGALSTALDFSVEEWCEAIDASVPALTIEVNRAAFERGREWTQSATAPERAAALAPAAPATDVSAPRFESVRGSRSPRPGARDATSA